MDDTDGVFYRFWSRLVETAGRYPLVFREVTILGRKNPYDPRLAAAEEKIEDLKLRLAKAEEGQQLWREMFAQFRNVATNLNPVVGVCSATKHVIELCADPERFDLEVERRISKSSDAITIYRGRE
jgi:hypothetical protein